jgi:hypothetical protein
MACKIAGLLLPASITSGQHDVPHTGESGNRKAPGWPLCGGLPIEAPDVRRHNLLAKIDQTVAESSQFQDCEYFLSGLARARDIAYATPLDTGPVTYYVREVVLGIDNAIARVGSNVALTYERNQVRAGLTAIRHLCATYAQQQFRLSQRAGPRRHLRPCHAAMQSFVAIVGFTLVRVKCRLSSRMEALTRLR